MMRSAASFPEPLAAASVTDIPTQAGRLYLHADDDRMAPFLRQHGLWRPARTRSFGRH